MHQNRPYTATSRTQSQQKSLDLLTRSPTPLIEVVYSSLIALHKETDCIILGPDGSTGQGDEQRKGAAILYEIEETCTFTSYHAMSRPGTFKYMPMETAPPSSQKATMQLLQGLWVLKGTSKSRLRSASVIPVVSRYVLPLSQQAQHRAVMRRTTSPLHRPPLFAISVTAPCRAAEERDRYRSLHSQPSTLISYTTYKEVISLAKLQNLQSKTNHRHVFRHFHRGFPVPTVYRLARAPRLPLRALHRHVSESTERGSGS